MECINLHKNHSDKQKPEIFLPELLAPAGSPEILKAAIKAGADAIYIGGHQFGARAYAENLSAETLTDSLHYAHFYNRKVYLTVNTLMKEKEIDNILYGFLLPYYEAGLDGVIVQDLGTASFIRRFFPDLLIHASTQMTITDVHGALGAKELGMTRVVPARELSLFEIQKIKEESGLEVEIFVHGALCYCYSGQCLLSSMYGGRSGNRGRCAQPCRLPWHCSLNDREHKEKTGRYLLSPKELCAIENLPALIKAGVDSLKIEGRMKNLEYAAGVTATYRKYLDLYKDLCLRHREEEYQVSKRDLDVLKELYSRDGFTDGYFHQHNGKHMMSVTCPRNLGRPIGQITQIRKYQIKVNLSDKISPGDILVIPTKGQEEIILTVPSGVKDQKNIMLNVPSAALLRQGMTVYRRKNIEISRMIKKEILDKEMKYPVSAHVSLGCHKPLALMLHCHETKLYFTGPVAEPAKKKALTKDDIMRQMKKTGKVPFYLESLSIDMDSECFLPMSSIKELRQQAFSKLQKTLETAKDRQEIELTAMEFPDISLQKEKTITEALKNQEKVAIVYDSDIFSFCLKDDFFSGICLPMDSWKKDDLEDMAQDIRLAGKKAYLSLPAIMRGENGHWKNLCVFGIWDGIYVHNINEAAWLSRVKDYTGQRLAGASFYQWNTHAIETAKKTFHITGCQIPYEISGEEFNDILNAVPAERNLSFSGVPLSFSTETDGKKVPEKSEPLKWEWMVYGRIPVMVSAQCPKKTAGCCDHHPDRFFIEDEKGRKLPVSTHCGYCYSKIWLDQPKNFIGEDLAKRHGEIHKFLFDFFMTEPDTVRSVKKQFLRWKENGFQKQTQKPDEHWNYGIR